MYWEPETAWNSENWKSETRKWRNEYLHLVNCSLPATSHFYRIDPNREKADIVLEKWLVPCKWQVSEIDVSFINQYKLKLFVFFVTSFPKF